MITLVCWLCMFCGSAFAADRPQPLIVALDWFVNPNHAPLFVAQQENLFQQQGVEVKFISPADTSEGEKMVAVNKADIAVTYQPALMYKVTNGLPLVRYWDCHDAKQVEIINKIEDFIAWHHPPEIVAFDFDGTLYNEHI